MHRVRAFCSDLLLVCVALFALAVQPTRADTPRPNSLTDTLLLMQSAYANDPRVVQATANTDELYLTFDVTGATGQISFPDSLHTDLAEAPDDATRAVILRQFSDSAISAAVAINTERAIDITQVIPVLRHVNYAKPLPNFSSNFDPHAGLDPDVSSSASDIPALPATRPFVGDIGLFLASDTPQLVQFVSQDDLETLGLSFEQLLEQAKLNMATRQMTPDIQVLDGIYLLLFDGSLETSFMTLTSLWQQIDAELGTILAIVAAPDLVLFTDLEEPGMAQALQDLAAASISERRHAVSRKPLVWDGAEWRLWTDAP